MPALKLLVLGAAGWSVVALTFLALRTRALGTRRLFAAPAGDPRAGIRYAFTGALSPTAKESARKHPFAWALGIGYHAGTFGAMTTLALAVAGERPAGWLGLPLAAVTLLGLSCGVALLAKRLWHAELRALSHPDDVVSNVLASGLSLGALAWLGADAALSGFLLWGTALLVYLPLGKLRHAAFFFLARRHLGAFFGRRGIFPPPSAGGPHGR